MMIRIILLIQRLPFAVTLMLLVAAGLLYPESAVAAAGDVLDQSQTAQNAWGGIGSGGGNGEVFTAGRSGYLTRLSLYVAQYPADPVTQQVNLSIQTVTGDGLPSGTEIGFGAILADRLPASAGWVDADIDGAFVTAGSKYALLASTSDGVFLWYMGQGDVKPYPAGYWVSEAGDTWEKILTNQDWTFQTYVAEDAVDQQTSGTGVDTRALGTTAVGQTFTVGRYGVLDRVSVYLTNSSTNPAPITVTIVKAQGGLPLIGSQVATGTIPVDAIPRPGDRGWTSASMSHFVVDPSQQYALLLTTSVSGPEWIQVSDVYPGGNGVMRSGTLWAHAPYDFAFQSYVLPPILDQAQTWWSSNDSYFNLIGGQLVGQYFTAHVSGNLDRVSVVLDNGQILATGPSITVGISSPSGPVQSGTIPFNWVPAWYNGSTPPWIDVSFGPTAGYVSAGKQYLLTLQEDPHYGHMSWYYAAGDYYPGGFARMWGQDAPGYDFAFKTYVLPQPSPTTTVPGPGGITPCSNGVCPAVSGGFNPANLTEGVRSHFQFRERPDHTVQGILDFSDPRPDGIALRGCTTESAACALTVRMLICTDPHSMKVAGTYTPHGGTATGYQLAVSGAANGPGTFSLMTGEYSFTLTLEGIVNVTCPLKPAP